jgi:FlaA1/EpsC-like NDP-sugar epimerase
LLLGVDLLIVVFSTWISYYFRFGWEVAPQFGSQIMLFTLLNVVSCGLSMVFFRMYNRVWKYASVGELIGLLKAVTVGWLLSFLMVWMVTGQRVPISVALLALETMILLCGGVRFLWRIVRVHHFRPGNQKQVLIVGAGQCGALIAREMQSPEFSDQKVVGFIDDDPGKRYMRVMGVPVLGDRHRIQEIVDKYGVEDIIIAIPSASKSELANIINLCKMTGAKVRMIPSINGIIQGKVSVAAIRDVSVEDLLGREPIVTDLEGIADYVSGKRVLVTGAGGSIGSELCRQIAGFEPDKLLLLGHGENSIYTIEMELRSKFPGLSLETIIADIQDRPRMDDVFRIYEPQVVFHAAAHKHVPLMERNPAEAVKNNVFGTKNVADCAHKYGAERFVMISTDKAVNPTSVMGATKRIAEMYIQTLDANSPTRFVAVRFGNVLGSRGSVIPRFKEQIAAGGPVTVTHPEMVRYFMTIPEAVQLVIQAGAFAKGGEIFVLDMGKPVKILDLAEDLIRLSGFEPYTEIPIEFTGIREGEKLFEELLTDEESVNATQHNRIFIGKPVHINRAELELELRRLERGVLEGQGSIREIIESIVPLYQQVS